MSITRFVTLYSQALAWIGSGVLVAVLVADPRWIGQIPYIVVMIVTGVALRGLSVPLSKYSYLNQTALVGIAGSLLAGLPATALAIAIAVPVSSTNVLARSPIAETLTLPRP